MSTSCFCRNLFVRLTIVLGAFVSTVYGQTPRIYEPTPRSVITLDDQVVPEAASAVVGHPSSKLPANFRQFGSARAGESSEIQTLTLRFAAADKLTRITSTKDFQIEPSGCVEGAAYEAKSTCTLAVRFTPQGPGHRFGKLTVADTASAAPMMIGLVGEGSGPVVSFTPSQITTVPGTFPSGAGLLSSALSLAVDGGDTLYMADTGNNAVRYVDSSGAIQALSSVFGIAAPVGITVDTAGNVYFTHRSIDYLQVLGFGGLATIYDAGTDSCAYGTTCSIGGQPFNGPGGMATDPFGNVFLNDENGALRIVPVPDDIFENGIPLYLQYNFPFTGSLPIAVDGDDNLYSYYNDNVGDCVIFAQSYLNAVTVGIVSTKVAGGRACGFTGDGGQARNAEIGASVGQFAFDIAGNFYFTDTNNNRVRRIDGATGIIHTIAGSGTAGYTGDGGAATNAKLNAPTGVAVDSQGQVYIISGTASSASAQVVRKVNTNGDLAFPAQLKGTSSAAKLVTVANTGNSELEIASTTITGTNKGDFSIDPTTTSCLLTTGSTLNAGQSCQIGIIFKPAASGTRNASLTLLDNTVNNSNTVLLSGPGTLPTATFAITAPAAGAKFTSGTTVKFSVSVTSASGAAPTGTVKFSVDGTAFGSPVTVASGAASINLTGLSVKAHTISAAYSGDSNYAPATASESITVNAAAVKSTVRLSSKLNPAASSKPISFAATVVTQPGREPQGTVRLLEGKTVLAKALLKNGIAGFTVPELAAGTHMVIAEYSGDSEHAPANSSALRQVVK